MNDAACSAKAAFLDRDGTLMIDRGYLGDPDGVELLPGVIDALKTLKSHGYLLIIVSNQSAVGRGMHPLEAIDAVNARMEQLLAAEGVQLDAILYCPHAPEEKCECRKPKPGLLLEAARRFNLDLAQSVMIGDAVRDIEAGIAAQCRYNFLIQDPPQTSQQNGCFIVPDLPAAVKIILSNSI